MVVYDRGKNGREEITKGQGKFKTFRNDGHANHLDYGDDFTEIYICQNL